MMAFISSGGKKITNVVHIADSDYVSERTRLGAKAWEIKTYNTTDENARTTCPDM